MSKKHAAVVAGRKKKAPRTASATRPVPHRKIFIVYLNDPNHVRNADLITLTDAQAKKKHMSRSEYVSRLIVRELERTRVIRH